MSPRSMLAGFAWQLFVLKILAYIFSLNYENSDTFGISSHRKVKWEKNMTLLPTRMTNRIFVMFGLQLKSI